MRIRVVGQSTSEPRSVVFASEFGGGAGYWNAEAEPVVGRWYHVELDAPEAIAHWSRASAGDPTGFTSGGGGGGDGDGGGGGGVTVCGAVEDLWTAEDVWAGEAPMVRLRVGDTLVTIEVKRASVKRAPEEPGDPGGPGGPGEPAAGDVIRFEIPWVELWPYTL